MFYQTRTAHRPLKGSENAFFAPGDLDLQTREIKVPNTFSVWTWHKLVQQFQRYFVHKQITTDRRPQKQKL